MNNTPQSMSEEELRLKIYNAVREGVKPFHFTKNGETYLLHVDAVDDVMEIVAQYSLTKQIQAVEHVKELELEEYGEYSPPHYAIEAYDKAIDGYIGTLKHQLGKDK